MVDYIKIHLSLSFQIALHGLYIKYDKIPRIPKMSPIYFLIYDELHKHLEIQLIPHSQIYFCSLHQDDSLQNSIVSIIDKESHHLNQHLSNQIFL